MKQSTWYFVLGGVLLFLLFRRKPSGTPKPTATAGTAGSIPILSDLLKQIPTSNVNDNTPALVNSATNAFGTVWKGLQSVWSTGKSAPASTSQTIGNAAPVDVSSEAVTSIDLGDGGFWPSYDFNDWVESDYWGFA